MAKKKNNNVGSKVLGGALIGGALGLVAGMLLAPKSGEKIRKDIKDNAADFYKYLAPKMKKLQKVGEKEYNEYVDKAITAYSKVKKLSEADIKSLRGHAMTFWKHFKKNH